QADAPQLRARRQSVRLGRGVVVAQHLYRPRGLLDLSPWPHLDEPRLDVQDRRSVDGVEVFDMQVQTVHFEQTAPRYPEPVDAPHVAVAEDADWRPVRVIPRTPRAEVEIGRIGEVEAEHDFQVGELFQSSRRVRPEPRRIDSDDRTGASPVVVGRFGASAYN